MMRVLCDAYRSLRMVHSSPPRHASISMYRYLLSLKVRYNLSTKNNSSSSFMTVTLCLCQFLKSPRTWMFFLARLQPVLLFTRLRLEARNRKKKSDSTILFCKTFFSLQIFHEVYISKSMNINITQYYTNVKLWSHDFDRQVDEFLLPDTKCHKTIKRFWIFYLRIHLWIKVCIAKHLSLFPSNTKPRVTVVVPTWRWSPSAPRSWCASQSECAPAASCPRCDASSGSSWRTSLPLHSSAAPEQTQRVLPLNARTAWSGKNI